MTINRNNVRNALKSFDFQGLFIEELGWDRPPASEVSINLDGEHYRLSPVAHKRGLVVFVCEADAVPNHASRQKIERQATKSAHEHIIIYTDSNRTTQVWQWVRREAGRPAASRQHVFHKDQPGDSLIQKLENLAFELDEEDGLTITTVAGRTRQAFDVDRVTKRFFDRFKNEHSTFLGFINGIQEKGDRDWYASLMLNRLMFVYFIQKKGFLDGDPDYLRNRLRMVQARKGKDKFHSFYRYFLLRLFHEGLGGQPRTSELDEILGKVPYLNGGLFEVHDLERSNAAIEISDDAFENVFEFFDAYSWHLDERPLHADSEINPDVLGYIFEKYVNQKEMGAYYTKEDITEYIATSSIVPKLFDLAEPECAIAFDPQSAMWRLVREDPDRYIYPAMRKGVDIPLPSEIEAGLDDISLRDGWNRPAGAEFALSSETWREHVERRRRCLDLRSTMSSGNVQSIESFVALNLDLSQFAQDVIENSEGPELLRAFYSAIYSISVLDPTCGSGAFLFAALNILEPFYEACLERMEAFISDSNREGRKGRSDKFLDFQETLAQAAAHPNRRYFILKSIILNNLFGVDIMEEAVEICKLRLFLKLAAQVETIDDLEPLPDIDFNIRAGNSLVGFGSYDEVAAAVGSRLDFDNTLGRIEEHAALADEAFHQFRELQTQKSGTGKEATEAKSLLRSRLHDLAQQLDRYLASEFGVGDAVESWHAKYQPFHWFLDFYGILKRGGFDVIIGNPPYVEYRNVRNQYTVQGFETLPCGDLYALVMERGVRLLNEGGRLGMITPVSIVGTDGFQGLRDLLLKEADFTYVQSFAERPSKLFTGVEKRLAIWVMRRGSGDGHVFASKYRRWLSEERDDLFATAAMTEITGVAPLVNESLPKVQTSIEVDILEKLNRGGKPLATFTVRRAKHVLYYTRKVRYFVQFFLKVPRIRNAAGKTVPPTELKELGFATAARRDAAVAALNSSLFFWFFSAYSDVRNVNRREVEAFPIDLVGAEERSGEELSRLAGELTDDFEANSTMTKINYAKHGILTIQIFRPRASKPVIDHIDLVLASLYGFTDEEADFIINFDIKYRLGADVEDT